MVIACVMEVALFTIKFEIYETRSFITFFLESWKE
jgi:hypothetical protein